MLYDDKPIYVLPQGVQTRWASPENPEGAKGAAAKTRGGRKGSACFPLAGGEERTLAEVQGASGTVRRIWVTISDRRPLMLRGLRIDAYWDGAARPAISAPLGDLFGQGLGRCVAFQSAPFSNPEGRSFNCYLPMPFKTGMRLVVRNDTDERLPALYYDVDYTLGDPHGADVLYLHAHWRRERPTTLLQDYALLPVVSGRGRFVGVNVGVIADTQTYFRSWWGEGEVKVYLDGDGDYPTLSGTGTEDYIGTGWGQGQYAHLYQGCHLADHEHHQYAFYRYHLPDPIYFHQDIRVTIQQIGCWGPGVIDQMRDAGCQLVTGPDLTPVDMEAAVAARGYGLFERQDDWSSCAYLYLDRTENGLPPLAPVEERVTGLLDTTGGGAG